MTRRSGWRSVLICLALAVSGCGDSNPLSVTRPATVDPPYSFRSKLDGKDFIFTLRPGEIAVKFRPGTSASQVNKVKARHALTEKARLWDIYYVFRLPPGATFDQVEQDILTSPSAHLIAGVTPTFFDQEGFECLLDPEWFTVLFQDSVSETQALERISQWGSLVVYDHRTPGSYTITVPSGMTVFEAVRTFMDRADVKFTDRVCYGTESPLLR